MVLTTLGLLFVLMVLLNCSGLLIPILRPQSRLASELNGDMGIRLPPSAVVEQAEYCALLDPTWYYKVRLDPPEADAFFATLVAKRTPNLHLKNIPYGRVPKWWTPTLTPGMRQTDFERPDNQITISAFHASGDKYVWILRKAY